MILYDWLELAREVAGRGGRAPTPRTKPSPSPLVPPPLMTQ